MTSLKLQAQSLHSFMFSDLHPDLNKAVALHLKQVTTLILSSLGIRTHRHDIHIFRVSVTHPFLGYDNPYLYINH